MKLSVVIPAHSPACRRDKALDSLRMQTLGDVELVPVESDGFPGVARNRGVELARGDYVAFCDDDDWVEPEMYAELVDRADETDADMVWEDYVVERGGVMRTVAQASSEDASTLIDAILSGRIRGFSWNKLFRRESLLRSGARFPEDVSYCEDVVFLCAFLSHGARVAYLPRARYHYVQHPGSLSTRSFSLRLPSALKAVDELDGFLDASHRAALEAFREQIKYDAMMCPELSGRNACSVFPEIRNPSHYPLTMRQRILFRFSMYGLRPIICWAKSVKGVLGK